MEQSLLLFFGGMIIGLLLFGGMLNNYYRNRRTYGQFFPNAYAMQWHPPERPRMSLTSLWLGLSLIVLISILASRARPIPPGYTPASYQKWHTEETIDHPLILTDTLP